MASASSWCTPLRGSRAALNVYPHSKQLGRFGEVDADVVLYGHTHTQLVRRIGTVLVVNPGSAGNAQDPSNGKRLSCGILDTSDHSTQILDFPDPARSGGR